jgi:hypothetical protein
LSIHPICGGARAPRRVPVARSRHAPWPSGRTSVNRRELILDFDGVRSLTIRVAVTWTSALDAPSGGASPRFPARLGHTPLARSSTPEGLTHIFFAKEAALAEHHRLEIFRIDRLLVGGTLCLSPTRSVGAPILGVIGGVLATRTPRPRATQRRRRLPRLLASPAIPRAQRRPRVLRVELIRVPLRRVDQRRLVFRIDGRRSRPLHPGVPTFIDVPIVALLTVQNSTPSHSIGHFAGNGKEGCCDYRLNRT